jgi:hypothetical protein
MRTNENGSYVRAEYFSSFKNIHFILPNKGLYEEFFYITSNSYYATLLMEDCVFTSTYTIITPIFTLPSDTSLARVDAKNVVVDGITFASGNMSSLVGMNIFFGYEMKVLNIKTTGKGHLIQHLLNYDDLGAYHNCEFTNVYFIIYLLLYYLLFIFYFRLHLMMELFSFSTHPKHS